jgi:hypothetical protein
VIGYLLACSQPGCLRGKKKSKPLDCKINQLLFHLVVGWHHAIQAAEWRPLLQDRPGIGKRFETEKAVAFADAAVIHSAKWQIVIEKMNASLVDHGSSRTGVFNDAIDMAAALAEDVHRQGTLFAVDFINHFLQIVIHNEG